MVLSQRCVVFNNKRTDLSFSNARARRAEGRRTRRQHERDELLEGRRQEGGGEEMEQENVENVVNVENIENVVPPRHGK